MEKIDGSQVLSNEQNSGLKKTVFNPVIELKGEEQARIWTSESVFLASEGKRKGKKLSETPYNNRIKDFDLRASNLPFEITEEEFQIMVKLKRDIKLFGNTVVELKDADKGWQKITLRNYQEKLLDDYEAYHRHLLMFPRQSGKTTTTIVAILHYIIFNKDKDIVVIAQSQTVVDEIMSKLKSAFSKLPFFMQCGVVKWTLDNAIFDNGCRLKVGVASESVVQGFSLDFLFIDEFAYIDDAMAKKFWNNILPALKNNPRSKCVIASTPNGRNLFYEMWMKSINKQNNFKPSRIYWYEVPRFNEDGTPMDLEKFKREFIEDSSLEAWLMGYECSFDTQLSSIFSTATQIKLREKQKENIVNWSTEYDSIGTKFDIRFVNKSLIPYDIKKDYFVLGIDIAEGLGQDSSVIKIRKICYENNEFIYKLIGIYQSNEIAVDDFARLMMDLSMEFDPDKIQIAVENNNYGGEFFNQVTNLSQYDDNYYDFDFDVIAKFRRDSKDDYEYGYRTDARRKQFGVSFYKRHITNGSFDDTDDKSIDEALNFGKNKKGGSYSAQYGHDDLVAGDIAIAFLLNSNDVYNRDFLSNAKTQIKIDLHIMDDPEVVEYYDNLKREESKNIQVIYTPPNTQIRDYKDRVLNKKKYALERRKVAQEDREFYNKRRGNINVDSRRKRLF